MALGVTNNIQFSFFEKAFKNIEQVITTQPMFYLPIDEVGADLIRRVRIKENYGESVYDVEWFHVIGGIAKDLSRKYPSEYEKWKKSGFDINYVFKSSCSLVNSDVHGVSTCEYSTYSTLLHLAARCNAKGEVIRSLVNIGANPLLKEDSALTSIEIRGSSGIVRDITKQIPLDIATSSETRLALLQVTKRKLDEDYSNGKIARKCIAVVAAVSIGVALCATDFLVLFLAYYVGFVFLVGFAINEYKLRETRKAETKINEVETRVNDVRLEPVVEVDAELLGHQ
ncbi:ankyrin repeat domain-containing protein [Wolbachia endosymbiont of Ctenocephalides felis wCfeT]|uniref:ankyrin repeat domain-containing protein n=1 Tax=Wolbachia endosymbiont of Ctenocephalides felis wCfeT TaxID=2732593 RepID=UPI001C556574|nr:ankyrin repeat domain-containing protein [Wolbachia endosymbiont of Ctenocephalides felis wCfeT]